MSKFITSPDSEYELVVIGGGPGGLAAVEAAWKKGLTKILLVERDKELGGILNQCIHNGFGLHYFKEELTGPEYVARFADLVNQTDVEIMCDTMAVSLSAERKVRLLSPNGYFEVTGQSVVLAMGCRERTRGAIGLPGARPAGIFTAGAAQRYLNMEGYLVGKRVVILGSGDIGLIMARRMTLEGAKVLACVELMPYSGGLTRNIVQCLEDFDIPLYLSHAVTDIRGKRRLEGITISKVDEKFRPVAGTEISFDCDTLLLSVGLLPETELATQSGVVLDPRTRGPIVYENKETSIPGVFACGNVVHVHDLVDFVTKESQEAGMAAAEYAINHKNKLNIEDDLNIKVVPIEADMPIGYTVPQHIHISRVMKDKKPVTLLFRSRQVISHPVFLELVQDGEVIHRVRKNQLAPGEMESFIIPFKVIEKINKPLHIRVSEEV